MSHATLAELTRSISSSRLDVVDARQWRTDWRDKWVAFVDLVGIAARSKLSPDTTVNQIVRFHRALSAMAARYPDVHLLRFTDAAYATSTGADELVRFVSDLQHYCLAMNVLQMTRARCHFHHLIVPRTTIASGGVLEVSGPLPPEDRFLGVDSTSLLIGSAIVDAYRLEKRTAGGLVSMTPSDGAVVKQLEIRGINRPPKRLLQRWSVSDEMLTHDDVVDLPWLLLRAEQPGDTGLWTTTYEDALIKLQSLIAMWKLSFREYTTRRTPIETIKHFGAVNRHLNELFQGLKGHSRLKAWGLTELEAAIRAERSRAGI